MLERHWRLAATAFAAWSLATGLPASAQQGPAKPLPPPPVVPESRLTVTPSDFQRWLSRLPQPEEVEPERQEPAPRIATPPPPPPTLSPTPAQPVLSGRPPAPPEPPSAPAAPVLPAPARPAESATLPPDLPTTTVPSEPILQRIPKPDDFRIVYAPDATDVPDAARDTLDGLAAWLAANPSARIQVEAFASQSTAAGSQARRLSLLRAREVRRYLIAKGAAETQIDVRALGAGTDEAPKDRVEIRVPSP